MKISDKNELAEDTAKHGVTADEVLDLVPFHNSGLVAFEPIINSPRQERIDDNERLDYSHCALSTNPQTLARRPRKFHTMPEKKVCAVENPSGRNLHTTNHESSPQRQDQVVDTRDHTGPTRQRKAESRVGKG